MDEIVTNFKAALDKFNADQSILANAKGTLAAAEAAVETAKTNVQTDLKDLQSKFDDLIASAAKSGLQVHTPAPAPDPVPEVVQ